MAKSRLRKTLVQLNALKESLGQDVLDFVIRDGQVIFLAHPTINRQRPSLRALELHVSNEAPLVFDPPTNKPKGPRTHWVKPGRLSTGSRPYAVW